MTRRYQEAEVSRVLQDVESGTKVVDVCRKYGVSRTTVHRWQRKYATTELEQLAPLKHLQANANNGGPQAFRTQDAYVKHLESKLDRLGAENARLKKIVVHQALDIDALRDLVAGRGDC